MAAEEEKGNAPSLLQTFAGLAGSVLVLCVICFLLAGSCDPGEDRSCRAAVRDEGATQCDCSEYSWGAFYRICRLRVTTGVRVMYCSDSGCWDTFVCADPDCTFKEPHGVRSVALEPVR